MTGHVLPLEAELPADQGVGRKQAEPHPLFPLPWTHIGQLNGSFLEVCF